MLSIALFLSKAPVIEVSLRHIDLVREVNLKYFEILKDDKSF